MPLPTITTDDILADVAAALKYDPTALPEFWSELAERGHSSAQGVIKSTLLARGFTLDQVNNWDRLEEFERDLSLFWTLSRGGAYGAVSPEFLKTLDRREELKTVLVAVSGVWIQPGEQPGTCGHGTPTATGGIFNWPGDDPNATGRTMNW